ncbi:MAG: RNA polymerase sigma factor [bacterium]|nr:RNA polymerase sigma factor [bacterium]
MAAGTPRKGRTVRSDERRLVVRHREGDPEAFAALVEEYRAPVYSYLARCGIDADDRDDVFQEIFIKIHRAAARYDAQRPVHPWIFTIVSNTARTYLRKRRVRQLVFAEGDGTEPTDPRPDGERRTAAREAVGLLESEIRKLSLMQREVVLLAGVEKLALKEVGEVLGIPVNTVKTHLRRARLALGRALERGNTPSVPLRGNPRICPPPGEPPICPPPGEPRP